MSMLFFLFFGCILFLLFLFSWNKFKALFKSFIVTYESEILIFGKYFFFKVITLLIFYGIFLWVCSVERMFGMFLISIIIFFFTIFRSFFKLYFNFWETGYLSIISLLVKFFLVSGIVIFCFSYFWW